MGTMARSAMIVFPKSRGGFATYNESVFGHLFPKKVRGNEPSKAIYMTAKLILLVYTYNISIYLWVKK
jgi:hypothetical protein